VYVHACARAALTGAQVLDLSRLESGKVELLSEVFDPAEAARTTLDMLAARIAEKGIGALLRRKRRRGLLTARARSDAARAARGVPSPPRGRYAI
jgi:signal transduction histidine kinase